MSRVIALSLLVFSNLLQANHNQPYTQVCGSNKYKLTYCATPTKIENVTVLSVHSNAACIQGRSWGFEEQSLWVDRGCSATFVITPKVDFVTQSLRCGSNQYKYNECPVPGYVYDARILAKHSNAPCEYGRGWGWKETVLWVHKGCAGEFLIRYRPY